MSLAVEIDGTPIADAIPPSSIAVQSIAKDGDVGFGGFTIDDPGADITTVGHKWVTIEESECAQPRLFTGLLTDRDMGRSTQRGMIVADDRLHQTTLVDLNAVFSLRIITYAGGKRPEETMQERLEWLLGYQALVNLVEDTGHVNWAILGLEVDAADYTGATPKAVLDDLLGRRPSITYFAFWDPVAEARALYFGSDSVGIAESSLSISNVIADINPATGVYAPDSEAKLRRTPEEVYSEVQVTYADGTKRTYRKRGSTSAAFIARGTTIERPFTQRASTAQAQADAFLDKHAQETDTITTTILVFPEDAGLVTAGQRIDVKFTHLPSYEDWTSMRVVSVNVRPANDVGNRYYLDLELEKPKEGTAPGTCTENSLGGIAAVAGPNTTVPDLFGASVPEDEVQDGAYATDGDVDGPYATKAWFTNGSIVSPPTIIREFMIPFSEPREVEKVTVKSDVHNAGAFASALDRVYMIVGGVTYPAGTYAVVDDRDGWPWEPDPYSSSIATFHFGQRVTTDSIIFGVTHDSTDWFVPFFALHEIAACLDDLDDSEEQEPPAIPAGSTVIAETSPTVDDDIADGYAIGQMWVNSLTHETWVLADNTEGAAVWIATSVTNLVLTGAIVAIVDGGGAAISGTPFVDVVAPCDGEITSWSILADQSGSAEFSVWKDTYGNFPPTGADSITAAAPPTLTTAVKATDSTLTGWTKTFSTGDTFRITLSSATTVERLTLTLAYTRT